MTCSIPRTSAVAFGVAAFASLAALSTASADSSSPAPTPSATVTAPNSATTAPSHSLASPAPTPGWAEAGPNASKVVHRPAAVASSSTSPSLNEPATTPGRAEAGPAGTAHHPMVRRYAHRHYAYNTGHSAYRAEHRYDGNPMATAATRVAGGVADVGSIAAYPLYCFPNYGSCSVRVPYRF